MQEIKQNDVERVTGGWTISNAEIENGSPEAPTVPPAQIDVFGPFPFGPGPIDAGIGGPLPTGGCRS